MSLTIAQLEKRVKEAQKYGVIKVNIIHDEKDSEGIWACLASPEDAKIYEKNSIGEKLQCFLMNQALITGPTWGARLTIESNGTSRPSISATELVKQMINAVASGDYPPRDAFKQQE